MDKLEKVIKGLQEFKGDLKPFAGNKADWQKVDDALELLKAQEPHVMAWEEAQATVNEGPFIIMEVRDSTGTEIDYGVLVDDVYEMSEGSILTVSDFWMLKDEYGKHFRIWTSRPDDERRQNTPWETGH